MSSNQSHVVHVVVDLMIRSVQYARGPNRVRRHPLLSPQRSSAAASLTGNPIQDGDDQRRNKSATIVQGPSLLASTGVHRPSPSLFHLPGLRSLPFWTAPSSAIPSPREGGREEEQEEERRRLAQRRHRIAFNDPIVSSVVSRIEEGYDDIKSEYLEAVLGLGTTTDDDAPRKVPLEPDYDVSSGGGEHNNVTNAALHVGSWDWHSCMQNGKRSDAFRDRCPKTTAIVNDLEEDGTLFGTPFGFSFFSTLHPKSSIMPHTGPMNLRLRIHLPLVVPRDDDVNANGGTVRRHDRPLAGIRVADQIREWHEGSAIVLDDSYVHEAWNDSDDQCRVVFLLDIWHPDVRTEERERIRDMFDYARDKGWIGSSGGESSVVE